MIRRFVISVLLASFASGCALGPGTNFSQQDVQRVHRGMSKSEVRAAMGPPNEVLAGNQRHETWTWYYLDTFHTYRSKDCLVEFVGDNVTVAPVVDDGIERSYREYFSQPWTFAWIFNLPGACFDRVMYAPAPRQGIPENQWVAANRWAASSASSRATGNPSTMSAKGPTGE
jgi:hypothetical protein